MRSKEWHLGLFGSFEILFDDLVYDFPFVDTEVHGFSITQAPSHIPC